MVQSTKYLLFEFEFASTFVPLQIRNMFANEVIFRFWAYQVDLYRS